MKFEMVPGSAPAFAFESVDLVLLGLAVPAMLGLFIGMRKEQAVFAAVIFGAGIVLVR